MLTALGHERQIHRKLSCAILSKLTNVTEHVIQAPGIGRKYADRRSRCVAIVARCNLHGGVVTGEVNFLTLQVADVCKFAVFGWVIQICRSGSSCPSGILPLFAGGKSIFGNFRWQFGIQPSNIFLRVIPRHTNYGVFISLAEPRITPISLLVPVDSARIKGIASLAYKLGLSGKKGELLPGDVVTSQSETLNFYKVLWRLDFVC